MPPVSISISDIIYVDFKSKQVVGRQVLQFDKTELLREGLIDFDRLIRRGKVCCVYDEAS
jgi:hypothetical protein